MILKIYTKKGDNGYTSLVDGRIVKKHNLFVNAYGTIDELNSFLGLLKDYLEDDKIKKTLNNIQLKYWENYCKAKILYYFGGTMMSPYFYFNQCPSSKYLKSRKLHGLYYVNEGLKNTNEILVASMDHIWFQINIILI